MSNVAIYVLSSVVVFVTAIGAGVLLIRKDIMSLSVKAQIANAFGLELDVNAAKDTEKEKERSQRS